MTGLLDLVGHAWPQVHLPYHAPMGAVDGRVLATVAFEEGTAFLTGERPSVSFGRASECVVRFGHQPTIDASIPRVAGAIRMIGTRAGADNLSEKLAFDLKTPGGPLETVRPGALLAPASDRFEIIYRGSREEPYRVLVHCQAQPRRIVESIHVPEGTDEPTRFEPDLTERQSLMLVAYTDPLREGQTAPATHKQVASRLNWSYATMRVECNAIWGAFKVAGVPMRHFRDKRDAVIDAVIRHDLRLPEPGTPPTAG